MIAQRKEQEDKDDGLLDVGALCRMFEESEDSTMGGAQLSERDRDYVDNIQLTADELAALEEARATAVDRQPDQDQG
jgi:hypothetical protein